MAESLAESMPQPESEITMRAPTLPVSRSCSLRRETRMLLPGSQASSALARRFERTWRSSPLEPRILNVTVEIGLQRYTFECGAGQIEGDGMIDHTGDTEDGEGRVFAMEGERLTRDVRDARDFDLRQLDVVA